MKPMIMNYFKLFLAFIVMLTSLIAKGQEGGNTTQTVGNNTVKIVSEYTPEIKDTKKIAFKPQILDTVYDAPKFNYSIISSRVNTPFQPRAISAAKMSGEKLDKIYNGYLSAGMGNYATPMFEFLYGMGRSRDQFGGVQLKHISSAGEISDYIYPGFSDNLVRGYYTKLGKMNSFTADAYYQRSMFHYYGVNTEDTLISNLGDLSDKANQHLFNKAQVSLDYGRYNLRRSKMNFDLGLDYYFLIDNYASRENAVKFEGFIDREVELFSALKKQKIGIESEFNFFNNSDSTQINNAWVMALKPNYKFQVKRLNASIGLNIDVADDSLTEMFFFPDVAIKVDVIEEVLSFGFTMSGGSYKQNFNDLSYENPFINSILPMEISVNKFRATFSMFSSISRYVNFQLGLDYQKWENGAFFITDTTVALRNKFTVVYDDYDLLLLKVGASVHASEKLDISAEARYYVYNIVNELFTWHKPNYEVKFQGIYRIGDKFRINADLVYTGPTHAPIYTNGVLNSQLIKPWLDGSIGVEYRYRKRLGFFLNLNNLSASQYQKYYNYPSQGFNFMAGMNYIFSDAKFGKTK